MVNHSCEFQTPLFDWRLQLDAADKIIETVRAAKTLASAAGIREKLGIDLSDRRESIARMLAAVAEDYMGARDDFEMRADPKKPHRDLEKNIVDEGGPYHDYGDLSPSDEERREEWERHYMDAYYRPRGNPGTSRSGGPPTKPARVAYYAVRDWWRTEGLGAFSPTFCPARGETSYDETEFNAPARFLLATLRI